MTGACESRMPTIVTCPGEPPNTARFAEETGIWCPLPEPSDTTVVGVARPWANVRL